MAARVAAKRAAASAGSNGSAGVRAPVAKRARTSDAETRLPTLTAGEYDAVVLDIEGTTTPLTFVHDTLFPYARQRVAAYLRENWEKEEVQSAVAALRQQAEKDVEAKTPGAVAVPTEPRDAAVDATTATVHRLMDADSKTTGLKQLQGLMWEAGYKSGQLRGPVFDDVPKAIKHWHEHKIPVFIYSSGSVHAQKLLFRFSDRGDLLPLLDGHFDTTTGPKVDASSYDAIAQHVAGSWPVSRFLFATDNVREADAAAAAKESTWLPVVAERPGNKETGSHPFPVVRDFQTLL